jgi:hypothetical protein
MRHRVLGVAVAIIAVLALTASASMARPTKADYRKARAECRAERGYTPADHFSFAQEWGRPRPFRRCVRALAREFAAERRQAWRDCRMEKMEDPFGFHQEYPGGVRQCVRLETAP